MRARYEKSSVRISSIIIAPEAQPERSEPFVETNRTRRGSCKAKGGINESVGCRRHWRDWTSIGLRASGKGARSDRDEQLRKWSSKPAREGRRGRSGKRLG